MVDQSNNHITVAWDEPEHDGGSAIKSYTIEKQDVGRMTWSSAGEVDATTFKFRAGRLFEGNSYYFRVSASNSIGAGPYVEMENPVKAKLPFGKMPSLEKHNTW